MNLVPFSLPVTYSLVPKFYLGTPLLPGKFHFAPTDHSVLPSHFQRAEAWSGWSIQRHMAEHLSSGPRTPGRQRILAVIPIPYGEEWGFWNRDLGLVVRGLREQGHDAWLVGLKAEGHPPDPEKPVIVATMEELADPQWWQRQNPDAIIFNAWAATKYDGIRSALLTLGRPAIEKLDTDGVKSPRIWPWRYLQRSAVEYKHSDPFYRKAEVVLQAIARFMVVGGFPALLDRKIVRSIEKMPMLAAETPVAAARMKRFLRMYHASPMPRVVTIPHPVNLAQMQLQAADQKENLVIAVARWDEAFKGWPLLLDLAESFLRIRPDWKFVVAGNLPPHDQGALARRLGDRFTLAGHVDHEQLSTLYRKAKIYLLTSYSESFNIAAAEALCCGCAVVGPAQTASVNYFTSWKSGTTACVRSPRHMTDALVAESDEWDRGERNPHAIAKVALHHFGVTAVTEQYLRLFHELTTPVKS